MLLLIGAVALLRYSRPMMLIMLGFVIVIPALGWAAYAIEPGPVPNPGLLLWLAFIPAIAGIVAGVWMLRWMSARRATLTVGNIERLSNGTLVVYGSLVVALNDVLALWHPVWAVANLGLSIGWALLWIPRGLRTSRLASMVDIAAPRAGVYLFIADPMNWPAYQEDLVSIDVRPAGELAIGSVVTATQRYETHVRGPRMLPDRITTASVVDEVVPESVLSMHLAERPASRSRMEFAETDGGTRITTTTSTVAPFRLAVFGALVELRAQRPERVARARRNLERLKRILESR